MICSSWHYRAGKETFIGYFLLLNILMKKRYLTYLASCEKNQPFMKEKVILKVERGKWGRFFSRRYREKWRVMGIALTLRRSCREGHAFIESSARPLERQFFSKAASTPDCFFSPTLVYNVIKDSTAPHAGLVFWVKLHSEFQISTQRENGGISDLFE